MMFSIITVCYNAEAVIERTIRSLLAQRYMDYEYIIKDGCSTDHTLDIATELLRNYKNVQIISTKDAGIYDAMNVATARAQGKYVYYLNAGDILADSNVLATIAKCAERNHSDIIYGNIIRLFADGKRRLRKYSYLYKTMAPYILGDAICHQAMFINTERQKSSPFETAYRVCADRDGLIYHLKQRDCKMTHIDYVVGEVMVEGFSKENLIVYEKEAYEIIKKYYPFCSWIYKWYIRLRHGRVIP